MVNDALACVVAPVSCKDDRVDENRAEAALSEGIVFEDAVRQHQAMVYSLAYNFLGNSATAEELGQDVFLALFQNLGTIKSPTHLVFWLRRVTSNRCLDYIRGQKYRRHLSLEDVPEVHSSVEASDVLLSGHLSKVIATLPEKARMVILLRYQEDLDPAEIARILRMPVNTVKSHLRRSLALLREKLGSKLKDYDYDHS